MSNAIVQWLERLGLGQYAEAFQQNDIGLEHLPDLDHDILKEIGVRAVGHRMTILKAATDFKGPASSAALKSSTELLPRSARISAGEAERRQLTVLFCDLVGSTELSAKLDPEDMGELMRAYQTSCAEIVNRWDGHVARYMGDGVLAYFGWPRAHEDDAERAVRAGLNLTERTAQLAGPDGTPLAARVGIATGLVMVGELVGEGAAQEEAAVGETPNLAARLQGLARPGAVVISQRTRQLLGSLFELEDTGAHSVKGIAAPVRAWQVVAEGRAESRFEALHGAQLRALVGREHELSLLLDRWERVKQDEGQVVLVAGEPGIGKSRIVRALRGRLADEPLMPLSHYCSPFHTNTALHCVTSLLERSAGFARGDGGESRLDKLEALLAQGTEALVEVVPLVGALLGIETGSRYAAPALSPQRQMQRTLEVLVDQVEGLAARQPVLAIYEDVHWADPTTVKLLDLLIERAQHLRVLLLITFRPEFSPPWTGHTHVMQLSLTRLTRRHGQALVKEVTEGKALPVEVLDQVVAKSDGVPLFVEELTKTVLESDLLTDAGDHYALAGPLAPLAIPMTLQESLLARLDRLASVKEVAQIGAVIGREFSHDLVAAVSPLPEDKLGEALDRLVASGLIFRRGTPPASTYIFKHALVQDTAYQSLLKSRRQQLHANVAQVLLEQHLPDTAPEVLAYHFTEAQQYEEAVPKWLVAGQAAIARSAYAEAAANLRRGLNAVDRIADRTRRVHEEIHLQNALGFALMTQGLIAESGKAYDRARVLCEKVDLPGELFTARFGLWQVSHMRLDLEGTAKFSSELLTMVNDETESDLVLEAHHAAWSTRWPRGELEKSLVHAAAGMNLYKPDLHHKLSNIYAGHDPGVCSRYTHGLASWLLGFPDQAAERVEEALALAHKLKHPLTLAVALNFASFVRQFRLEPTNVRRLARQAFDYCTEQGFPFYAQQARVLEGWALAAEGQFHDGIQQVQDGLASLGAMGADARRSYFLGLLAEVCLRMGQRDIGLEAVAEGLDLLRTNGERWWQAELHRLHGELLLIQTTNGQTKACSSFDRALHISRQQKSKCLELRAATSLARFLSEQGNRQEARDLLAPICDWFTEGFDTADLKAAKALLQRLS